MAGETIITVVGNLVDDPELRFTPAGAPVANFRLASTPRTMDRATSEWKDGEPLFLPCTVWRQAAENVAESLTKGMRVIVQGRLASRTYEDREGQRRSVTELHVEEIGPALKYASARVQRNARGAGGQAGYGGQQPQSGYGAPQGGYQAPPSAQRDPWATQQPQTAPAAGQRDPWATPGPGTDEPPF